jgi:hypothetical protein
MEEFEGMSVIAWKRGCLSGALRRPWLAALPVGGSPVGGAS